MKRTIIFLATAVLILAAAPMFAQAPPTSASTNFPVTAHVDANCTISTLGLDFGAYDPLTANATAGTGDLPGTGVITVTCTKGTGTELDLDLGTNATGSTRRMAGASGGDFLTYELYKEAAHTNVFGTGATDGLTRAGGAGSKAPWNVTVYGNLPGGQDVTASTYSDIVQATIQF